MGNAFGGYALGIVVMNDYIGDGSSIIWRCWRSSSQVKTWLGSFTIHVSIFFALGFGWDGHLRP